MLIGRTPRFVDRFGSQWDTIQHIKDTRTIEALPRECVFIALNLEGWVDSVNEIGIAIVHASEQKQLSPLQAGDIDDFHQSNGIEVHTITILEQIRDRTPGPAKHSRQTIVAKEQVADVLDKVLADAKSHASTVVLIGYDMYTEFDWMSQYCPQLLDHFRHWVDVQELVEADCGARPSLAKLMAHLSGLDLPKTKRTGHRAATDAMKMLGVLSVLQAGESLKYHQPAYVKHHDRPPRLWERSAFRARLTAADGGLLPRELSTTQGLVNAFSTYDLKAVVVDDRTVIDGKARECWVSFHGQEPMHRFAADADRFTLCS